MNDRYTVERIMEIIAYVMGARAKGTPLAKIDVAELSRQGYTDGEISAAFSWIMEGADNTQESHNDSFRMLHGLEEETITPDAWGMLLSYRNLGFLSNEDLEQIIERAMVMGHDTDIDVEELRAIVAVYLMHRQEQTSGDRHLLSGTESVN
jgi:uncharacterized protein Smg (DUF494 family)